MDKVCPILAEMVKFPDASVKAVSPVSTTVIFVPSMAEPF
jgi:hypothetical protein